jgi:hypothetical protein
MAILANDFSSIFSPDSCLGIYRIISDYISLKGQLDQKDKQTWYFQQGLDSNQKRLEAIKKEYEIIRNCYNSNTAAQFEQQLVDLELDKEKILKSPSGFTKAVSFGTNKRQVARIEEYLSMKEKEIQLLPIDQYQAF